MRPSSTAAAALIVAASLSVTTAMAAAEAAAPQRFESLVRRHEGAVVAVAPRDVDALDPADPLRSHWDAFRDRNEGRWKVYVDERTGLPTLVSGRGIGGFVAAADGNATLEQLEGRIRTFVNEYPELLGERLTSFELDADASGELREGHWQLIFRQTVDGVRVENSRMEFQIVHGKLTMFGTSNWGRPTTDGVPRIAASDARDFLDAYLGDRATDLEPSGEAELVLIARDPAPSPDRPPKWAGERGRGLRHELVWRLQLRDPATPSVWVGEIDAHDGAVLAFYDGTHYVAIRGGVYPEAPDVGCVSGGCELDDFPMPHADWTEVGQPVAFTDGEGELTCSDPTATFTTTLDGRYAIVEDTCGPLLETSDCDSTLQLGLKLGENCDVAPGASAGNTAAARSAYYHVNRVNEVARFYNPSNAWLDTPVRIHTNWNQTCNASYGGGEIYLYRSGTSWATCANSGEIQGIAVHEWGHGYDDNDGGDWDNTSEAYGDVVAMLASRDSCFGPGLFTDGRVCSGYGDTCLTCTGFRDHDWAAREGNSPATPQDFVQNNCPTGSGPCGYSVHCESYPIGEAVYDLATRDLPAAGMDVDSAWQLVERLWYSTRAGSGGDIYTCALPASDSCSAGSWYQHLRGADDDDGNLSNGTPHAAALYAAFDRHNIACGASGDPENQSTSSCPALAAPILTVGESESGPQLQWAAVPGAAEYLVYRGDLGCNRQQAAVATVAGGATTYLDGAVGSGMPRYYRVEAVGANAACRSAVSNCEISSAGPRLQKNGHGMLEDGINDNLNGFLDPGETVRLPVTLFNGGTADALAVSGRLRTVDPSQGRVVGPLVSYPDIGVGEAVESADPHFELTLFDTGVACGETVFLELEMDATDAATRTDQISFTLGEMLCDFVKVDSVSIPRITQTPVTSTLDVVDDRTIAELDVSVNIGHPFVPEIIVELSSPTGTTVRLHDHSGGAGGGLVTRYDLDTQPDGPGVMADFAGETTAGTWTLAVQDTVLGAPTAGVISGFTLHVTPTAAFDCDVLACAEATPASPDGLVVGRTIDAGDGSVDLDFSWAGVGGAAGYHVLHSTVAPFAQHVDLTGRTSGATTLFVADGAALTPELAFFQVRAVNGCNEESP